MKADLLRRSLVALCAGGLMASFLVGCDKLDIFNKKKPVSRVNSASVFPVRGTLVAKVNNIPITLDDLNDDIDAFNKAMDERDNKEVKITTREDKIKYLKDELVRQALLYQEALDKGLDTREEVVKALEKTKMNLLVVELLKEETEKIDVSSKEVEDYYNTYKDQLKEPEQRRVSEIVVASEPEARDILIQLLQGSDFATLAKEKSKAADSKSGGDAGFIKKGTKFSQFDNAVFSDSLDVGKMSSIFKGPDGYYIIKLEAKKGGTVRSLSEMWDDIKRGLTYLKQQQKIDELVSKASKEAKIEVYEGEIK